jgi:purine nucleosidase
LKKIIIDTDTASDDAVALVMALREPALKVVAITTVMGNITVEKATRNALMCVEYAGSYQPPVYEGMAKPMFRPHRDAAVIHGVDGMGDLGYLKEPTIKKGNLHAVDAIIKIIEEGDGDIELVTIGPLTNIGMAIIKAPEVMKKVPCITIMGGAAFKGNTSPLSEFNIWEDAEAADIMFGFSVPVVMAAIEACRGECEIMADEMDMLQNSGSRLAKFCVDINRTVYTLTEKDTGIRSFTLPDPTAITVMVRPDIITGSFDSYTRVETKGSDYVYGTTVNDRRTPESQPFRSVRDNLQDKFNCKVVYQLDSRAYKDYIFSLIMD